MKHYPLITYLLTLHLLTAGLSRPDIARAESKRWKTQKALPGVIVGVSTLLIGNQAEKLSGPDRTLFSAPLGPDRLFRDLFFKPGKETNWLDAYGTYYSVFGGLAGVSVLSAASFTDWPSFAYDVLAYSSGAAFAGGLTRLIKGLVSRPRPYVYYSTRVPSHDAEEDYRSFVSGHASMAFYAAAFLYDRLHREQNRLPRWLTGTALFGWAAYVAYSRIEIDQHYFTDVAAGALLGIAAARLTVRWFYGRPEPASPQQPFLGMAAAPLRFSMVFTW